MPAARLNNEQLLDLLAEVFRQYGFEGASLTAISKVTGLQRASLYHRFPGGKREMAEAVLSHAGAWVQANILDPLAGSGTPKKRLERMIKKLDAFYSRGGSPCLLDSLSFGEGGDIFGSHIKKAFSGWIDALARLVVEATGCSRTRARERAEDVVARIQGALVLARGTGNRKPFRRMLNQLPEVLLASEEG